MQAVKNATGLLIGMSIMVKEPSTRPETADWTVQHEYTLEEAVAVAKGFEDAADIMFIKASSGMTNHPTGFNQDRNDPVVLRISRVIKESGARIITAPNAGFRDPESNDAFIAAGQTDMVAMARTIIADPDYGQKAYEGRGEDIVPCIMCNKCHGLSMTGPWVSVCSVNPKLGLPSAVRILPAPTVKKKVAVIGGGPAGMQAAITAAERGHRVTLYEKSGTLGGLLRHADHAVYKWPLKEFKDYLVRQTEKIGVEVKLNATATPEMIAKKGFEVVMAAVGATPSIPRIPGADGPDVWDVIGVYGNEKKLGKNVAFIGGGEYGVETAMHLAKSGHNVTVLTSSRELIPFERVHYPEIVMDTYEHLDGFRYITDAIATGIADGKVAYTAGGNKKAVRADSVVIYAGLKANQSEALKFSDAAGGAFYAIGDCTGRGGDVQKCIRDAFFMASQI
jgi:NADPH-dependent 2,4-dienoyl-CoA reductase/sulfur reductase-like enzyme